MPGATITGWGAALPETVLTNADLEARLDTSDAWIRERTGIRERRIGGTTIELAIQAGAQALKRADEGRYAVPDVDMLIVSTNTPDPPIPATAAYVQDALGLNCGVFDLNSGCSGFVYALVVANGLIATGMNRVLVIASDTVSRIVDPEDRSTAVLFGDGAGACVLEAKGDHLSDTLHESAGISGSAPPVLTSAESDLLGFDLGSDGSAAKFLYRDHGGYVVLDGQEVFRRAVRATITSARKALDRAGVVADDIALFVPHQANLRIMEAVGDRLSIPMERTMVTIDRMGNTSSASIPLALAEAADGGRIKPGDLVLMSGFGAGLTWASAVIRWG